MEHLPKAKTAKLSQSLLRTATCDRRAHSSLAPARTLLDLFAEIPGTGKAQIELTKENIDWAKSEKRIFLKQNLETRLVSLYIDNASYRDALALITSLLRELKRLDDKMILTEVHLLESRVNHALANMPKAKVRHHIPLCVARLTKCDDDRLPWFPLEPPPTQSTVLRSSKRSSTCSLVFSTPRTRTTRPPTRTFSKRSRDSPPRTTRKQTLLSSTCSCVKSCSISSVFHHALTFVRGLRKSKRQPEDVASIIAGKLAQRYPSKDIDALKAVAKAHEERNLADFEKTLRTFKSGALIISPIHASMPTDAVDSSELSDDPIVRTHLASLYDTLLEQNLVRIIEPYSRVEISHVAEMVKQPLREVEAK